MGYSIDESIMDRVIVDFESVSKDINNIFQEFLQFKVDKHISSSVGTDCLEKLNECEMNIRRRLNEDFSIVVIGDFKRGKSTLINAIVGEQVVTTNVTPETVTINRVSYGEKNSVEAVLKDGRRVMLKNSELNREVLDNILLKIPSEVDYIDIKIPVDGLKGIRIVDTPGVGDLLNKFDNQVKNYMVYADAVIYVVSALSPLSESEQTFLCASILPQNFSKLFVVLNMVDCLDNESEVEKIKSLLDNKLANIFPNSYTYAISALDEYCRRKNLKRPNLDLAEILEESFENLYNTIQNDVIMKKDIIQTERCLNMLKIMISQIEGRVNLIDNMMDLNDAKLNELICEYKDKNSMLIQRINKHKETIKFEIKEMQSEASAWIDEFLDRLSKEISSSQNIPLESLEKHFKFYMIDMIRSAIIECTNTHIKSVIELLKNASETFASEVSNYMVSECSTKIPSSVVDVSWTNLDAVAVALNFIPGLGALTLLGQAIIGFTKQKNTTAEQQKYINSVLSNYQEVKDKVMEEVGKIYTNIVEYAEKQLDNIYENQIKSSIEAVKQAQDIAKNEFIEKENLKLGLEAAKQIIESAKVKLCKIEKKVYGTDFIENK